MKYKCYQCSQYFGEEIQHPKKEFHADRHAKRGVRSSCKKWDSQRGQEKVKAEHLKLRRQQFEILSKPWRTNTKKGVWRAN